MKFERGNVSLLRGCTPHIEQDGSLFFCFHSKADAKRFVCAPVIIDCGMKVGFDAKSGKRAQDAIKAFLAEHGITATYDY